MDGLWELDLFPAGNDKILFPFLTPGNTPNFEKQEADLKQLQVTYSSDTSSYL